VLPIYRHTNAPHIAPEIIAEAYGPIGQALAAAEATGDPELVHRANHLAMPIHYVLLKMGPGSPMWRAVEARNGPVDAEALSASFDDAVTHYRVNVLSEGGAGKPFFEWAKEYGSVVAKLGVPAPPELADADWTRVRLIQGTQTDKLADGYGRAEGASDGWAIRPGFGKEKLLHYLSPYNDFEEGNRYRAWVRARATGITDEAQGEIASFSIGDQSASFDVDLLRDGQWHTVEVGVIEPEGAATAVKSSLFWRNRKAIGTYAIDCFWIERVETPALANSGTFPQTPPLSAEASAP